MLITKKKKKKDDNFFMINSQNIQENQKNYGKPKNLSPHKENTNFKF